jgi:hypothetical protein
MPRVERVAIDAAADGIAALIVAVLLLMAVGAQRLQLAEHERIPIAAVWLDVVGDACWPRETSFSAARAQWLDHQLMSAPVSPAC